MSHVNFKGVGVLRNSFPQLGQGHPPDSQTGTCLCETTLPHAGQFLSYRAIIFGAPNPTNGRVA
jgi:hypothetical protein